MPVSFIHLRLHSEYSLKDGLIRLETLPDHIAAAMPAVALTDHMNLFATVKFFKACEKKGIKPILGADLQLIDQENPQKPYNLLVLCEDNQGYANLRRIISKAYLEGQAHGFPQVEERWIWEYYEGLIILSGGVRGQIGQALMMGDDTKAHDIAKRWQEKFYNNFFLELQRTNRSDEEQYISRALVLAKQLNLPVVATNDVCFMEEADFEAHEARVCIHNGWTLPDPKRPARYSKAQYLKMPAEMQRLFQHIPSALLNTVEIAKRCNVTLTLGEVFLPHFPIPSSHTVASYLTMKSEIGLSKCLMQCYPDEKIRREKTPFYESRLKTELTVIIEMGFSGYFLIVADFIEWSKKNDIPVGPGRGSGAGSLVAYVLGITALDPLLYDLLFERFLNPERVSLPDFDVDFCMAGRDRVIDYVAQKYGRESVSQIITYGTMAAKAVVRDVGRVMGHPYGFVDKIAKLIPFELGMTLAKALKAEETLRRRYEEEAEVRELIDLATRLEGIVRNAGKHAGGVVIAPSVLTDFTALYCEPGSEHFVTQFDKDDIETIGLVKFDFLGLRTLTIIHGAMKTINEHQSSQHLPLSDITAIPVDDKKTFNLLKSCQTTAVFQLESRGMKDLIKRLQPDCFEDIIALVALYRPGPLQSGMVDDFINRKHGMAKVEYLYPALEPILKATYGVILYQEQVMQIAQVLAGYTLGGADLLRRAMGKKKPEEMAEQRKIFIEGASLNGVASTVANAIFDLMEKFAGYGFNKSHSAAYALVAYQTAWLKTHYPAEFMASVLSSDMDNTDKVVLFLDECKKCGVFVKAPHINEGDFAFRVEHNEVIYGLGAVKGVGEAAVYSIVAERRSKGSFYDLFEFCQRLSLKKINRRVIEALIKAGAMDCFQVERSVLCASIDLAIETALQSAQNLEIGQADLFATLSTTVPQYVASPPWSSLTRLSGEKETLGFYLSGHPIAQYEKELQGFATTQIAALPVDFEQTVTIAGLVVAMRTLLTKRGDRMAFITVEDQSGRLEIAVFSDLFQEVRALLASEHPVIIQGDVSFDDYTDGLRMSARKIWSMEQARSFFAKALTITLDAVSFEKNRLIELKKIVQDYPGHLPIRCQYRQDENITFLRFDNQYKIAATDLALEAVKLLFGQENVSLLY